MHRLLEVGAKIAEMLGLIISASNCKYLVNNRKRNCKLQLWGQELEEPENLTYLGTVSIGNDTKFKEN